MKTMQQIPTTDSLEQTHYIPAKPERLVQRARSADTMLDAALDYARRGWRVFPVYEVEPDGACSCFAGAACSSIGKHPRTPNGFKDATTDPHRIREWWTESPDASIAHAPSDTELVIDVDPRAGGDKNFENLVLRLGPLPPTARTLTGGGGEHLRFLVPSGQRLPKQLAVGVDLKGSGSGYVLLPPSSHASGTPYEWAAYGDPEEQAVAELPSGWLAEIKRIAGNGAAAQLPEKILEGQGRNNHLTSLAGSLRRRGASEAEVLEALRIFNKTRCEPPLDEREVLSIAKSISRYEPETTTKVRTGSSPEGLGSASETAVLLEMIEARIRHYVVLTDAQARVLALWVLHTYAIEAADSTPYLSITSAEKRSGKTRLLEILALLVFNPWLTQRATAAVLPRKIERTHPTFLLDESDAAFNGNKEYAETLRGLLNAGHRRGSKTSLCTGQGANITDKDFDVFCPKAIAGIGSLPDTVADRSIPIRLKRKSGREQVERFRVRNVEAETIELRARIVNWVATALPILKDARPDLPEALSDRAADGAEPLLAIADLAGGDWPTLARAAIVGLCSDEPAEDASLGVRLLSDIRKVMDARRKVMDAKVADRITSADLCLALNGMEESPWSEWGRQGKPISPTGVAKLLKAFGIGPGTIKTGEGDASAKGYYRKSFTDAWERYLPPVPENCPSDVTPSQANQGAGFQACAPVTKHASDGPEAVRICLRSQTQPTSVPAAGGRTTTVSQTSHDQIVTAGKRGIVNSDGPRDGVTAMALDSGATDGGACSRFIGLDLRKPCEACGGPYASHNFQWPSTGSEDGTEVLL